MNRTPSFRVGTAARNALWAAFYAVIAVLATAPLSLHPASRLPDDGDAPQGVWIAWWAATHLLDPRHLFEGNAYYPHPHALLYSEPLLAEALFGWPLLAWLDNRVLAVNLLTLATLAAGALAVHVLARELTGDDASGLVAAALYAFGAYTASQLPRLQLVTLQWMPLALLFLLRFARRGRPRDAVGLAGCTLLVGLGSFYYLAFFAVALVVLVPFHAVAERGWHDRRGLGSLAISGTLAALMLAAVAVPYLRLHRRYGFTGDPAVFDLAAFFTPPWGNPLYGRDASEVAPHAVDAFLGYATLALAVAGIVAVARRGRAERAIGTGYAILAVVAALLAGGPELVWQGTRISAGPFRWIALGPLAELREPGRFAVLALLAVGVLAALGSSFALRRFSTAVRVAGSLAIAAFVLAEQRSPPRLVGVPVPAGESMPEAYRWLAARGGTGPLLEAPVRPYRFTRLTSLDAYFATHHRQQILLARPSVFPPAQEILQWELRDFPDARSIALLQALGVREALVHPARWDNPRFHLRRLEERADRLPLVKAFPEKDDAVSRRYQLGGERLHAIAPAEDEGRPRECACVAIDRAQIRVSGSGRSEAARAIDGRRETRWTSGDEQRAGQAFDVHFASPRRPVRVEIEMAYPYGEFPRHLGFEGSLAGAAVAVRHREDIWYTPALVRQLVADPRAARLRYDLEPAGAIDTLRLHLTDTEWGALPWSIVEMHVYEQN